MNDGESVVEAAKRLVSALDGTVLPIQGPPGAGKTFTAARMILMALDQGKRVGVTVTSHKVIRNLLDDVQVAAEEAKRGPVSCVHKITDKSDDLPRWLREETRNEGALDAIHNRTCEVLAGTAWINDQQQAAWRKTLDVFVEDEQCYTTMSLFPDDRQLPADALDSVQVKLSGLELRRPRVFGNCWLACELWQQLGLDEFWQ